MAIPDVNDGFWYDSVKQNSLTGQWNNQQKKDAYEGFALARLRAKYENIGEEQQNASTVRRDIMAKENQEFDQAYKIRQEKQASKNSKAELFTTVGGLAIQNAGKLFGSTAVDPYTRLQVKDEGAINKLGGYVKSAVNSSRDIINNVSGAVRNMSIPGATMGASNVIEGFDSSLLRNPDEYVAPSRQFVNSLDSSFDFTQTFSGLYDSVSSWIGSLFS